MSHILQCIPAILLVLLLPVPSAKAAEDDIPIMVAHSGSEEVDQWVAKLVSHRPDPFPPNGEIPEKFRDAVRFLYGSYKTNEVAEAIENLKRLGPASSPYLLAHLHDDRYSYSTTLPSSVGIDSWFKVTVGMAVRDVITGGFESGWLYKWREGRKEAGYPPPQFADYLKTQGGLEKWAQANSKKTNPEVFTKFIDWCIETERNRGFSNQVEEDQLLNRYRDWRKKVEEDGTGRLGTIPESKSQGEKKTKPDSEERPR